MVWASVNRQLSWSVWAKDFMRKGNLFVISGPSGVGKGTLVACLLHEIPDTWESISATTRNPREGDVEGKNYYFKTEEEFKLLIANGELLEWAEYSGYLYGTPRKSVEEQMAANKQVVLEIDVQGALQVRAKLPEAHLVFIEPPSMEVLESRLRGRGTEDEPTIQKRLAQAVNELAHKEEYDYRIVNDDLSTAAKELIAYVNAKAEEQTEE